MRSIAVLNQKGGVGKTTTAVNLSAALADAGQRVALIDLDPQAHASLHLGIAADSGEPSIYNVLTGGATIAAARRQVSENLWLIPSHIDLAAAEVELVGARDRQTVLRDKLLEDAQAADSLPLDFLIIDCPPSLGILTLNALTAVDEVLLPLQPHFLALHGLSKLLETIDLVATRMNDRLRLAGIVFCLYESGTRLATEVASDVEAFLAGQRDRHKPWSDARLFPTRIRRNIRLAEAPSFGQSIFQYAADSHGAEDYRRLAEEVLEATSTTGAEGRGSASR